MNNCEQHCDCVFTKEEIEKYSINNYGNLVDLTKQPSYRMSSGLTREERRKYMKEVGRPKHLLTKEQVRKIGEHSLRMYAETSPSDFKAEDFIDLTNESDKGDIVADL